jgi:magnesium chelatase family protein
MELSVIHSRAPIGIQAPAVRVEVHLSNGLPGFHIVGLPETAVRESRERVRSALINSHFRFPSDRRITVNLAPADLPKEGGGFDLPIAIGILAATRQLPAHHLASHEFFGELALGGELRAPPGVIPAATGATGARRALALAADAAALAAHVPGSRVIGAPDLLSLCAHLNGSHPIEPSEAPSPMAPPVYPDIAEVHGQALGRRALEIAASGGHNLLFTGPPGTGKTLLASRLPGILPEPCNQEALTSLALHSMTDGALEAGFRRRPFRSPHHTATPNALVGGGSRPRPGEISLAHGGVLFLDELPEFNRAALEALREPLESGEITISRARYKVRYPASFQLVAAMNPCPCGFLGDSERPCHCDPSQIQRYRQRISGPLLDRIDLQVQMSRVPAATLLNPPAGAETSAAVRARVCAARARQTLRQRTTNANLTTRQLGDHCALAAPERSHLERAANRFHLSARALHRILRVARTIADMEGEADIAGSHLKEALAFRLIAAAQVSGP